MHKDFILNFLNLWRLTADHDHDRNLNAIQFISLIWKLTLLDFLDFKLWKQTTFQTKSIPIQTGEEASHLQTDPALKNLERIKSGLRFPVYTVYSLFSFRNRMRPTKGLIRLLRLKCNSDPDRLAIHAYRKGKWCPQFDSLKLFWTSMHWPSHKVCSHKIELCSREQPLKNTKICQIIGNDHN